MIRERKSVLLLTASHLSSCPRLIKKAISLESEGYVIKILYVNSLENIKAFDDKIQSKYSNWHYYNIDWTSNSINDIIVRITSKFLFKISDYFNINSDFIHSTTFALINKTKKIRADLYIAHQPSVLIASAKAASKFNAILSYDIEDAFAFVEEGRFEHNPETKILNIEKKYINQVELLTYASPSFLDLYKKLYNINCKSFRLLNVFDNSNNKINISSFDRIDLSKISLYWFSQTIGLNRGLQDVLTVLSELDPNSFELHLRGNCSLITKTKLLSFVKSEAVLKNIYFHELIEDEELFIRNREHDIGLSLEISDCLNRELCITNKIFEYVTAGLTIVASNSIGNSFVMNNLSPYNFTYDSGNHDKLLILIKELINDSELLNNAKNKSKELALSKFNWSIESKEWLKYINVLLN